MTDMGIPFTTVVLYLPWLLTVVIVRCGLMVKVGLKPRLLVYPLNRVLPEKVGFGS